MKFAVIETGGKQYRVEPGTSLRVEKLPRESEKTDTCTFDKVLLVADGSVVHVGKPYLEKTIVTGKILRDGREKKKIVFKYHSKNRFRKKKGHRQSYTEVEITSID
jgi:large subunit ribosomal protein L21